MGSPSFYGYHLIVPHLGKKETKKINEFLVFMFTDFSLMSQFKTGKHKIRRKSLDTVDQLQEFMFSCGNSHWECFIFYHVHHF